MKQKLLVLALMFTTLMADSQKNYWKSVSINDASKLNKGKSFFPEGFQPSTYKLFMLDEPVFTSLIAKAPYEKRVTANQSNLRFELEPWVSQRIRQPPLSSRNFFLTVTENYYCCCRRTRPCCRCEQEKQTGDECHQRFAFSRCARDSICFWFWQK